MNLESMKAKDRIKWSLANLPETIALSSSFGIQSAVLLHMVTQERPDIPVILIDTGYLFPETYRFIDTLTEKLNLNLKVYKSEISSAWLEARHGNLWNKGVEGLDQYNQIVKVKPLKEAMEDLNVSTWFSGLRREQASTRTDLPVIDKVNGRFKVLPIIDWTAKDVHYYLQDHGLPYHPLWEKGYMTVGDWHTSRPLELGMSEEETRFHGLKRECGIHDPNVMGDGI